MGRDLRIATVASALWLLACFTWSLHVRWYDQSAVIVTGLVGPIFAFVAAFGLRWIGRAG